MLSKKISSFIAGLFCGLSFAPIFFLVGIFSTSIFIAQIKLAKSRLEAIKFGYIFGFGFYLSNLYWISFALTVYIDKFWWAIPFVLFGVPAFMAIFMILISLLSWQMRNNKNFHFFFCVIWVLVEWIISWIFTGFPWSLAGYVLSNWLVLTQIASIFGIFGISFFVIYISSSFYNLFSTKFYTENNTEKKHFYIRITISVLMIVSSVVYGHLRLGDNPTKYTNISARLVQPSIMQSTKWDPKIFWQNLDLHTKLSKYKNVKEKEKDKKLENPNIIIWSEAALTVPYNTKPILKEIITILQDSKQILLTGGVSDNNKIGNNMEIYSSLIGINRSGDKILEYYKSHLVPFGEYTPMRNILPLKKITHGAIDYTEGKRTSVRIKDFNLTVWPLICYEVVFPYEVIVSNKDVDLMVNITNDSWYGNSSGPYQHFEISRMRAIENGLPMVRTANNGISAFIDPVGRVLKKSYINEVTIIDSFIPQKLSNETLFTKYSILTLFAGIIFMWLLFFIIDKLLQILNKNYNFY